MEQAWNEARKKGPSRTPPGRQREEKLDEVSSRGSRPSYLLPGRGQEKEETKLGKLNESEQG